MFSRNEERGREPRPELARNTFGEARASVLEESAICKFKTRNYSGAIADYDEALKRDPNNAEAYANRGVCKLEIGDCDGAQKDADEATRLNLQLSSPFLLRGFINIEGGKSCRPLVKEALERDPGLATRSLASLVFHNLEGAMKEFRGDVAGAIKIYDRALKLYPDYALLYRNRGHCKKLSQDLAGALTDVGVAIHLDPVPASFFLRGDIKCDKRDFADAIEDYNDVRKRDPEVADAVFFQRLGRARSGMRDYGNAIADYDRAAALDPDKGFAYALRAGAKLESGDLAGAKADLEEAMTRDEYAAGAALVIRGLMKYRQEDFAGVIDDLDQALKRNPRIADANLFHLRGDARHKKGGDFMGAGLDYREALVRDPARFDGTHMGPEQVDYAVSDFVGLFNYYIPYSFHQGKIF